MNKASVDHLLDLGLGGSFSCQCRKETWLRRQALASMSRKKRKPGRSSKRCFLCSLFPFTAFFCLVSMGICLGGNWQGLDVPGCLSTCFLVA